MSRIGWRSLSGDAQRVRVEWFVYAPATRLRPETSGNRLVRTRMPGGEERGEIPPATRLCLTKVVNQDPIALYIDCISSRHEKPYCRILDIYSGPLRLEPIFQFRILVDTGQTAK